MHCEKESDFPVQSICGIMEEAGEIMRQARRRGASLEIKSKEGCGNFVTAYDLKIQRYVEEKMRLLFPEAVFFAEESDGEERKNGDLTVYLDPIDGTGNFIYGSEDLSISLAVFRKKKPLFGVVYLPYTKEMFHALSGQGAYRNGEKIQVSSRDMEEGLVMAGSASYYKEELGKDTMKLLKALFRRTADFRRYGSASVEMCFVACGRADLSFEMRLFPWDYAASTLIVREAGGVVSNLLGDEISYEHADSVLCASPRVYDQALHICRSCLEKG